MAISLFRVIVAAMACVMIAFAVIAACSPRGRAPRWMFILGGGLIICGVAGFFGAAFSALGGLPGSYEWPMGYATGVVTTADGHRIVPHDPSGRIQVYDRNWTFVTGWHIDAGGGTFKILPPTDGRIEVLTARGNRHYIFDMEGRVISESTYAPDTLYSSTLDTGESMFVPTAPWLLPFTHPFIAWGLGFLGVLTLAGAQKLAKAAPRCASNGK